MARAAARSAGRTWRVELLEDRATPAAIFAVGSAPGSPALVSVFDAATRQQKFTIAAYEASFTGGVNVAVGDVNGDGTADVIAGAGPGGGSTVKVYSGTDGTLLKTFTVGDELSRAGASVAAADYDQDGLAEVVIGTMRNGQPLVQVLRFSDGTALRGYTPFEGSNGVSVATGDVNGDGTPDTVVGAGPNGGPRVTAFDGRTDAVLLNLFAFEPTFTGGVKVSAGDLNGDGRADVIAAAGFLGGPRVQVFSGPTGVVLQNFFAYSEGLRAGVSAAAFDGDGNGTLDVVTVNGLGLLAEPKAFDGRTLAQLPAPPFGGLPVGAAYDTTAPTPTVSSSAADPTGISPVPFQVVFSEAVNGFSAAGLTVTNGTVGNFVRVDARTYTFGVTPTADGAVEVAVEARAATDAAGNASAAARLSRTFDTTAPAVTADPLTTNSTTPTLTGTVGETNSTVTVTAGGQVVTATVAGTTWSATIPAPLAEGTYTVNVIAVDPAGNTGTGTGSLVIDTTAPGATLGSSAPDPTGTSPIPFTVTFDEDVTGFAVTDPVVTNGTASGLVVVDARTYTFTVTPTGAGGVTVFIPAQVATDAAGNGNTASNTVSRTFQTGTIALTADLLTTNDTTPTLTGTVADPTATVVVTIDGQTVTAVVSGTTWSATLSSPLAEGTYDIRVSASNPTGGTGSTTLTGGLVIDTTAPTAAVTTTVADPTNATTIPFTVTFSEDVNGFDAGGLSVQNGTVSNFTRVDARTFTFDVSPGADGTVSVSVNAGVATDAAGNGNTASNTVSVTSDRTAPTPTVGSSAPATTDTNPIPFTVTFDEDVTAFAAAGVTATNGSVHDFTPVDARTYTFGVVPAGPGDVTVSVAAGAATDAAGNGNVASNALTRTFTGTVTTATISTTATDPTNLSPIPFSVTFTDDVTGFDQTDLSVGNGAVSDFTRADARTYTFTVTPAADGPVTIDIAAGAATDTGGSPTAAASFTITSDRTAPTAAVTTTATSPTSAAAIPFTVTFSEDVNGFDDAGLVVANGSVSNFVAVDARTYTFDVTPDADGDVTVAVAAGAATDAAGNGNAASNTATVTSDTTDPSVVISTAESDPTAADAIPFTVTFSEDVAGFDLTGLDVANGSVSNFAAVDARTYTFDVAPAGDGLVTVTVPAGTAQDLAGNGNTAGVFSITSERFAPVATVSSSAAPATNVSPIPFTVTFSEAVVGFDQTGLDVTNGSVTDFTPVDARTYAVTVTPDAEGVVTVSVLADAARDAAGNGNPASAPLSVTYDTTAPAAPVIGGLDPATDTGSSDTDGVTSNPSPTITGTAEAGAIVEVFADSGSGPVSLGTAAADGGGDWSLTPTTPLTDGTYAVTATATDAAGNTSDPSAVFTLVIDTTSPVPTVTPATSDPSNASPIPFTVTFDEDVAGFDETVLDVTNGSIANFTQLDPRTYTFDVTPAADGLVVVSVPAGVATDAAGNGSADASFSITSDRTAPTPTVAPTADDPTNLAVIPFTVTFGEDVTGFDETDLAVDNGTASDFSRVDDRTYTFNVTPTADGPVTITIAAGAAVDPAGNPSNAASFSTTADQTAPAVAAVTVEPGAPPDGAYGVGTVIDILVTFDEPVVVDTTGGTPTLALNSGGVAVYVGGSGTDTLTFRYTVLAGENSPDLDYTSTDALTLDGATMADAAGNAADPTLSAPGGPSSLGAAREIVIDTTAPTVAVDTESTGGLGGTAHDTGGSGIVLVEVSILDVNGTGLYWDEATEDFTSEVELFFAAAVTAAGGDSSAWSYSLPPAVTGDVRVTARATDAAGNQGFDLETVTIS